MLPDLSVLWVIAAILVLAVILDRWLFKPVLRVIRERETAVQSAMQMAEDATAKAKAASAEFDAKMGVARADLYKQLDERRKAGDAYRTELIAKTRGEVDKTLADARTQLDAQVAQARTTLERDADQLGREIADKVLGRTN
ncbi:MAG: ATP synthase F0 subunit B [Acidobacteria bacterium]|nr:ATP synthase F0 subunit B [Acidobacteriota bacterium]